MKLMDDMLRDAILGNDGHLVGQILSGVRDITGCNVLDTPTIRFIISPDDISLIKRTYRASGTCWDVVGRKVCSVDPIHLVCELNELVRNALTDQSVEQLGETDFWSLPNMLRKAIQTRKADDLAKLLWAIEECAGPLSECPAYVVRSFYDDGRYWVDIRRILLEMGEREIFKCRNMEQAQDFADEDVLITALARFALCTPKLRTNLVRDLVTYACRHSYRTLSKISELLNRTSSPGRIA